MVAVWLCAVSLSGLLVAPVGGNAASTCLADPTQASCSSYVYPEDKIVADIGLNCQQMPWMVGCSVWNACQAGKMSSSQYCAPFSVLASSCLDEGMGNMRGCLGYTKLCSTGSRVKQCTDYPGIPQVVQTAASQVSLQLVAVTALSCPLL
jgi:hypothetical protein